MIREIARGAFRVDEEEELDEGIRAARKEFAPVHHVKSLDVDSLQQRFAREIKIQASPPSDVVLLNYEFALDGDRP